MIIGLMSTYREGALAVGALRTLLPACHEVLVLDAAVYGVGTDDAHKTTLAEMEALGAEVEVGPVFDDDADKRNHLLRWAKHMHKSRPDFDDDPLWCIWLDGDELLMWGEWLPDWIARADEETGIGGFPMRIVELDGSVAYSHNRVFRADRIRKFLVGASQAELHTGMVVALPNTPICGAGGIPVHPDGGAQAVSTPEAQAVWLARCRPPVAGEPHVLHRSVIRSKHRAIERQHEAEGRAFTDMLGESPGP